MSYTFFDNFVARQRFRAALPHIRAGSRVCDIGCGLRGAFLQHAGSRIRFGVGLDYQPLPKNGNSLSRAFVRCDIVNGIPLNSGQFDHVVMLAVLEHLEKPKTLLQDIYRILIPGGSLILTWPQPLVDPLLHVLHRVGLVSHEMESDQHQQRIPTRDLISLLGEIGFQRFRHERFELGLNNLLVSFKGVSAI